MYVPGESPRRPVLRTESVPRQDPNPWSLTAGCHVSIQMHTNTGKYLKDPLIHGVQTLWPTTPLLPPLHSPMPAAFLFFIFIHITFNPDHLPTIRTRSLPDFSTNLSGAHNRWVTGEHWGPCEGRPCKPSHSIQYSGGLPPFSVSKVLYVPSLYRHQGPFSYQTLLRVFSLCHKKRFPWNTVRTHWTSCGLRYEPRYFFSNVLFFTGFYTFGILVTEKLSLWTSS